MKKTILTVMLLVSAQSFAMSGKVPPANNHSGSEQCAFYDSGKTEEHSPHRTMEECRAKHGSCEMRCFIYQENCKVEGVRVINLTRPDGTIEHQEEKRNYSAIAVDEWRAREMADHKCRMDYPYNDFCRDLGCSEDYSRTR